MSQERRQICHKQRACSQCNRCDAASCREKVGHHTDDRDQPGGRHWRENAPTTRRTSDGNKVVHERVTTSWKMACDCWFGTSYYAGTKAIRPLLFYHHACCMMGSCSMRGKYHNFSFIQTVIYYYVEE